MDHGARSRRVLYNNYKESSPSNHGHCWHRPHTTRCLCLYLLLSVTLLVAVAAVLLVVFITRLKKPAFYLQSIQMDRSFTLRPPPPSNRSDQNGTAAACAVAASLVFAAQNPNGIGIRYGATVLGVAYADESVGAMDVPSFYQPPRSGNVTVPVHAVLAERNVTRLLVRELSAQRSYMEIRVTGSIDARTHVMNFALPKVQFSLDCRFGTNYTDIVLREGIESMMTRKAFLVSSLPHISQKCSIKIDLRSRRNRASLDDLRSPSGDLFPVLVRSSVSQISVSHSTRQLPSESPPTRRLAPFPSTPRTSSPHRTLIRRRSPPHHAAAVARPRSPEDLRRRLTRPPSSFAPPQLAWTAGSAPTRPSFHIPAPHSRPAPTPSTPAASRARGSALLCSPSSSESPFGSTPRGYVNSASALPVRLGLRRTLSSFAGRLSGRLRRLLTSSFQVSSAMAKEAYYGNFIRNLNATCQSSVVRIRFDSNGNGCIMTGVVVASNGRSCVVVTSNDIGEVNQVEFFDGTIAPVRYVKIAKEFNMAIMLIIGFDQIHWEVANFSQVEAVLGQKVFTVGYDNDNAQSFNHIKENGTTVTVNFISGSLVSSAGIKDRKFKDIVAFVHACSTGTRGYMGSAVFSETENLVGVNFFYTTTKGVDYGSGGGGLVSAMNLQTIKRAFQSVYANLKGKSLPQIVQSLQGLLTSIELKEATAGVHEG